MIKKTSLTTLTRNNKLFRKSLKKDPVQEIIDGHERTLFFISKDNLCTCKE